MKSIRRYASGILLVHLGLLQLAACAPTHAVGNVEAPKVVAPPPEPPPVHAKVPFPPGWVEAHVPSVARSKRGMVVSDAALATEAGAAILARGGNAVDAAITTAFALAVVFPTAGNLGGGGFAVVRRGDKSLAIDFRETAPGSSTRDMFLDKATGKTTDAASEGATSAGVPGSVAGLYELHRAGGPSSFTWADLLAPAIRLAEEGFVVSPAFHEQVDGSKDKLSASAASLALFFPGGVTPPVGAVFRNPDLAKTLRGIAKDGPSSFYEGETARLIAEEMKRDGGFITEADLKAYKARVREPLETTYRGHRMVTMPPPSSGGLTVAMICHLLEPYDLHAMGFHSSPALHYLFEGMRRGFAARNAKLGDPDFVTNPVAKLLGREWADSERKGIDPERATPSSAVASGPESGTGPHTTNLEVVDANGDAVALTTTVNHWFGSGVTVKGAGFVLNNEMDDFASVPGEANRFALVQGEVNSIAPGKRMLSSMSPTIVLDSKGRAELVLGAAGGPTILTSVLQELSNVIDFGLSIEDAVIAPRFHQQHLPDVVFFEKGGLDPAQKADLEARGYTMKERSHIADAPAIAREGAEWVGVGEPRRLGALAKGP